MSSEISYFTLVSFLTGIILQQNKSRQTFTGKTNFGLTGHWKCLYSITQIHLSIYLNHVYIFRWPSEGSSKYSEDLAGMF